MRTRPISEDEFDELLRTFQQSAFRLETRDFYALDYEQAEFDRFLAGSPTPPPDVDWWRPWLDQIKHLTAEGKTVSRVRILADPPTDYQRWLMWADPWHAAAGERISYLARSKAGRFPSALPLPYDWWLLDDERVIVMRFADGGQIKEKHVTTDPTLVARHREWRKFAAAMATPVISAAVA